MGRRKRKAVSYRPIRKAPTQFACPNCGQNTMKVEKLKRTEGKAFAIIKCSNCLLEEKYEEAQGVGALTDPVDVYAMLVDAFYGEDGDKQSDKSGPSKPAPLIPVEPVVPAPVGEIEPVIPPVEAVVPKKAKVEAKPKIAILDLEMEAEAPGKEEITEDLLKEAYSEDDDEVLDEIKKDKKGDKLLFPDEDLDDDL
jgi:transcription elongation factor Elf1